MRGSDARVMALDLCPDRTRPWPATAAMTGVVAAALKPLTHQHHLSNVAAGAAPAGGTAWLVSGSGEVTSELPA